MGNLNKMWVGRLVVILNILLFCLLLCGMYDFQRYFSCLNCSPQNRIVTRTGGCLYNACCFLRSWNRLRFNHQLVHRGTALKRIEGTTLICRRKKVSCNAFLRDNNVMIIIMIISNSDDRSSRQHNMFVR